MTDETPPNLHPDYIGPSLSITPKSKVHRFRPALLIVATLAVVTAITFFITQYVDQSPTCLNASDYKDLTGEEYVGDISSTEEFYSFAIDFPVDSSTYDTTAEPNGQYIINQISSFYNSHKSRSIYITIYGYYLDSDDKTLTEWRYNNIRADLISVGVPADIIRNEITVIGQEANPEDDPADEGTDSLIVSLASAASCR